MMTREPRSIAEFVAEAMELPGSGATRSASFPNAADLEGAHPFEVGRATVSPFPRSRELDVVLPAATAHHLGSEATGRWGSSMVGPQQGDEAWVMVSHGGHIGQPYGGVRVRFAEPGPATAQVLEVGWDPAYGGSAEAVLGTLNALLGWPILR